MQIVGPLLVGPIGQNSSALELKPFQRVTAQIVQVTGTQVVLSIDGIPIVADVPSNELAADLKDRASAQFIVSQVEGGKTVLRLAEQSQSLPSPGGQTGDPPRNLPLLLLKEYGLPVTLESQAAAQAAINQRLALQPGQLEELLRSLASLPNWGAQEANLAAAILAAGLPLTPQSLELAARPEGLTTENLAALMGQLQTEMQNPGISQEMRGIVASVFQALQETILNPGATVDLPEQLSQAVQFLGRPLENLVVEGVLQEGEGWPAGPGELMGASFPGGQSPGAFPPAAADLALQPGASQNDIPDSALLIQIQDWIKMASQVLRESTLGHDVSAGQLAKLVEAFKQLGLSIPIDGGSQARGLSESTPADLSGAALKNPDLRMTGAPGRALALQVEQLQTMAQNSQLPPETRDVLNKIFSTLLASVQAGDEEMDFPAKLADAVRLFGQAGIHRLGQESGSSRTNAAVTGLAALAHLHEAAAKSGNHELARVLDDFFQGLSKAQWENIPSRAQNSRQDWIKADLWMKLPLPNAEAENVPIKLRIDRQPEESPEKINASHAHMIVQVELPGKQVFQVEIGLCQRQVKTDITVPTDELYEAAQAELTSLAENLADQGYSLGNTRVEVGQAQHFEKISVLPARGENLSGVDREA